MSCLVLAGEGTLPCSEVVALGVDAAAGKASHKANQTLRLGLLYERVEKVMRPRKAGAKISKKWTLRWSR